MSEELSEADRAELCSLEEALWRAQTRNSPAWMESVLAPEFEEVGASGRVNTRAMVVVPHDVAFTALPMEEYRVASLGGGGVLARYVSRTVNDDGSHRVAERASVWRRHGGRWLLVYHQGTLVPC
jgi:hypothetical protein